MAVLPVNGLTTGTINWQTFSHLAFAFRITPDLLLLLWPNGWGAALGGANSFGLPGMLHLLGYWLFWPSLALALSSAWGYLRAEQR